MADLLEASVELVNQKVKFKGTINSKDQVFIDYTPPAGDGEGYTSLELLLLSLSSCSGTSVVSLLRKMKKNISGFKVNASGIRRETHPLSFEKISLEFVINSRDVTAEDVQKAIKLSEDTYCPVWALLKNNVEINTKYQITNYHENIGNRKRN
jgi:putative redox protein